MRKNSARVRFPLVLDVDDFLSQMAPAQHTEYRLYGICSHSGSIGGGHYTAVTHHLLPDGTRGEWYFYSDTQAHPTSVDNVLRTEAYLLFYARTDLPGTAVINGEEENEPSEAKEDDAIES